MYIAFDDLLAVRVSVAGVMSFPLEDRRWSVSAVGKLWSHYDQLQKFSPVSCVELAHYQDEFEWSFLVSPFFDLGPCADDESQVWRDVGSLEVPLHLGRIFVLDIAGRALKSAQEKGSL